MPHINQHAPEIHTILVGVTYMHAILSSAITAVLGFALGWYIKGRGMTGVKIDLANIKTDVENLKAKITPPVVVPVAPVV